MAKKKQEYVERWRDAGNGRYLSPEEAKKLPPNEVVKERDKVKKK